MSCRAMSWLGPAPGMWAGRPTPDTAALTSTRTQAVNCAHASQTTTVRTSMNVVRVIGCWRVDRDGTESGSGQPTK